EIKTDKSLDKAFDCLGNSFPMARVLGFLPKGDVSAKELQTALDRWKKDPNDRQKTEAALKVFANKSEQDRRVCQYRRSCSDLLAKTLSAASVFWRSFGSFFHRSSAVCSSLAETSPLGRNPSTRAIGKLLPRQSNALSRDLSVFISLSSRSSFFLMPSAFPVGSPAT